MPSYLKSEIVRCKAILVACRTLSCQHCGADDGTVVAAHSNWLQHGKGMGRKADDRYVAALCFRCHSELDQGSHWPAQLRRAVWLAAHTKTMDELIRRGLWPEKIPLPQ